MLANGIMACILAYTICLVLNLFLIAFFARMVGIPSKIFSYGSHFQPNKNWLNSGNVQVIFLMPSLIFGLLAWTLGAFRNWGFLNRSFSRQMVFWLVVTGYNFCFGQFIGGVLLKKNAGYLVKHGNVGGLYYGLAAAALLGWVAIMIKQVKLMLRVVYTSELVRLSNRPQTIFVVLWAPFVVTSVLVVALLLPTFDRLYYLPWFLSIIVFLPLSYRARTSFVQIKIRELNDYKIYKPALALVILAIICIRIGLSHPILFFWN